MSYDTNDQASAFHRTQTTAFHKSSTFKNSFLRKFKLIKGFKLILAENNELPSKVTVEPISQAKTLTKVSLGSVALYRIILFKAMKCDFVIGDDE